MKHMLSNLQENVCDALPDDSPNRQKAIWHIEALIAATWARYIADISWVRYRFESKGRECTPARVKEVADWHWNRAFASIHELPDLSEEALAEAVGEAEPFNPPFRGLVPDEPSDTMICPDTPSDAEWPLTPTEPVDLE